MIPALALMVGAYILTRMVDLILERLRVVSKGPVVMLAIVTIGVTLFSIVAIFQAASEMAQASRGLEELFR